MATTAYKYPGTAVDAGGGESWSNVGNVMADDGAYAYSEPKTKATGVIKATNFGFTTTDVPAGSTINGIEVSIEHKAGISGNIHDNSLYLQNGSATQVGSNKASGSYWAITDEVFNYGSSSDTWSASLTAADIIDSDFGILFSAYNDNSSRYGINVDYIKVRITYTAGGGGGPANNTFRGLLGVGR